jgi:hypothetical protein
VVGFWTLAHEVRRSFLKYSREHASREARTSTWCLVIASRRRGEMADAMPWVDSMDLQGSDKFRGTRLVSRVRALTARFRAFAKKLENIAHSVHHWSRGRREVRRPQTVRIVPAAATATFMPVRMECSQSKSEAPSSYS